MTFKDILRSKINQILVLKSNTLNPPQLTVLEHILTFLETEDSKWNHLLVGMDRRDGKTFLMAIICLAYMLAGEEVFPVTIFFQGKRQLLGFMEILQGFMVALNPSYKKWSQTKICNGIEIRVNHNQLFYYIFSKKTFNKQLLTSKLIMFDDLDCASHELFKTKIKDLLTIKREVDEVEFNKFKVIGFYSHSDKIHKLYLTNPFLINTHYTPYSSINGPKEENEENKENIPPVENKFIESVI